MRSSLPLRAPLMGLVVATAGSAAASPVPLPAGEYELTAQTVLPHLEEALRYATTQTRRCLTQPDATTLFPLLQHEAFAGCRLVPVADTEPMQFLLQCKNPEAATGSATVELGPNYVSAVVQLKMGGKNMTLSQRIYGPRLGPCAVSGAK